MKYLKNETFQLPVKDCSKGIEYRYKYAFGYSNGEASYLLPILNKYFNEYDCVRQLIDIYLIKDIQPDGTVVNVDHYQHQLTFYKEFSKRCKNCYLWGNGKWVAV